jgi:hypothetical protein
MTTTRFLRQIAFFSLLTVLATACVQAQQSQDGGGRQRGGRGGFGGPGGMMGGLRIDRAILLRVEKVRSELKIEEAQAATIDAAIAAYREESQSTPRPDRDAFEKMSEEERMAYFEKSRKEREELSKKADDILVALLDEPQVKRLDEIAIQVRVSMATSATLKAEDIKSKLMITEEQVAKLDEVEKQAGAEMMAMFQAGRGNGGAPGGADQGNGNREEMRTKMEAMRKKSSDAAIAVLTEAQAAMLTEMKGAPFEINPFELMGGRGGFGGPPGGGGAGGGRQRGGRPPAE